MISIAFTLYWWNMTFQRLLMLSAGESSDGSGRVPSRKLTRRQLYLSLHHHKLSTPLPDGIFWTLWYCIYCWLGLQNKKKQKKQKTKTKKIQKTKKTKTKKNKKNKNKKLLKCLVCILLFIEYIKKLSNVFDFLVLLNSVFIIRLVENNNSLLNKASVSSDPA